MVGKVKVIWLSILTVKASQLKKMKEEWLQYVCNTDDTVFTHEILEAHILKDEEFLIIFMVLK